MLPLVLTLAGSCAASSSGGDANLVPCGQQRTLPQGAACGLVCRAVLPTGGTGSQPVTTVWINGRPARMVIDSGASTTSVTTTGVQSLALGTPVAIPGQTVGIGGVQVRRRVLAGSLALGDLSYTNQPLQVVAMGRQPEAEPIDGLLGEDILRHFEIDFDLPHQRVTLYTGRPCGDALPGWTRIDAKAPIVRVPHLARLLAVPVTLDNQPASAMIDSGAETTVLGAAAIASGAASSAVADEVPLELSGVGPNAITGHLHLIDRLDVGGQSLTDVEVKVAPLPFSQPEMVLGDDYLDTHKVWISNATGQVYFGHTW
jgi:predicted aspartyl protease